MNLRLRLIVAFFLLSVVPLAAVTLYTYTGNANATRDAAGHEATLLAGEQVDQRDRFALGIAIDVDPAAIALGHQTEDQSAYRAHHQREEDRFSDLLDTHVKVSSNRLKTDRQNEKIKGIQRPSQKTGNEGVPLRRIQAPKFLKKTHIARC